MVAHNPPSPYRSVGGVLPYRSIQNSERTKNTGAGGAELDVYRPVSTCHETAEWPGEMADGIHFLHSLIV